MAEGENVGTATFGAPETPYDSLQSKDTRNLLDVIDNLRSQGISRYIDLPQIIVCGEQSSGKSSVLEGISGLVFPTKDNLCTRFATELVLRRGPAAPIKISIVPGPGEELPESDKEKLLNFSFSVSPEDLRLGDIIESAKEAMGINDTAKVFSSHILRVEISGPEQPHLTLVDLPGLYQAGSRSQSDEDSDLVTSLVLSYMIRPRSIILAVVSAKSEFNNQSITRHARRIDPKGIRTLGLITKPDTLNEGSESERSYVELAQNRDVKFRLGWHVLRNRDYHSRNSSLQERNRVEEQFFASGAWRSLPPAQVGIHSLKPRLSKILKDQIVAQLPSVLAQIKNGLQDCTNRLDVLGASRATAQEQRRYLLQVSQSFSDLIKAASDGLYSNLFFGSASTNEGYQKRLRAVLQNTLTEFADAMHKNGHTYDIVDESPAEGRRTNPTEKFDKNLAERPHRISRQDYISKVKTLLKRSRGRELPGTFDPLIIEQLFYEQRKPWAKLVDAFVDKVSRAVYHVVHAALAHISDQPTSEGILKRLIYPKLEVMTLELQNKVNEILNPHEFGHPITYNHYLTENVQKAQAERQTRKIIQVVEQITGVKYASENYRLSLDISSLISTIVSKTVGDMNNYASFTATDFMEAYYKVALKKVIDDISVLAIEARLINQLPTLFSPDSVLDIDDVTVTAVAAEDEDSSAERARYIEKRKILEAGLNELKSVQEYRSVYIEEVSELQSLDSKITNPDQNHDRTLPSMSTVEGDASSASAQINGDVIPEDRTRRVRTASVS